ncbi:MAG: MFS transporter [Longicatena sp.]
MKHKLFHKDFTLMIIGQIISLFGNAILRFSLSLYVLDTTNSPTAFATILAISIIPTILLSPLGGLLADRISKKRMMLTLDFLTAALIFLFSMYITPSLPIYWIGIAMIVLSVIQACYQPSVSASIPSLCQEEDLMQANGVVVQVNALANLLGPLLGGILYSVLPFTTLLWIASLAFFLSAIIECIMHIPFVKQSTTSQPMRIAYLDLKEGMNFILHKQPILAKMLLVCASLNLVLSCLMSVGLPIISNIILKLPPQYYGYLQSALGIGTIIGSLLIPFFNKHFTIKNMYQVLVYASLCLIPLGAALLLTNNKISFLIVLFSSTIAILFATIFNIYIQTFIQQTTPHLLLGKVSSFVTMIVMCSYPIGQSMYGILFDKFSNIPYMIVFIAALLSILISFKTKKYLKKL